MKGTEFLQQFEEECLERMAGWRQRDAQRLTPGDAPQPWEKYERLRRSCWTEAWSVPVLGSWLATIPDTNLRMGVARQVADEAKHFLRIRSLLQTEGEYQEDYAPYAEWRDVYRYIEELGDFLDRLAGHNFASELVAIENQKHYRHRLSGAWKDLFEEFHPDEEFHVRLGRSAIQLFANDAASQQRVRQTVFRVLELHERSRQAFNRLAAEHAAAEPAARL